jgi:methylmalonyl-CoA mutase
MNRDQREPCTAGQQEAAVGTERDPAPNFDVELDFGRDFPGPSLDEWRQTAEHSLKGRPLDSLTVTTLEGLQIKPLYTASDLPANGFPTAVDFTEGWQTCCPVDLREGDDAVLEAARGLARGGHSLWLRLDRRASTWGRLSVGVMARMLEVAGGAPLFLDARGVAPALAALMAGAAEQSGVDLRSLRGGFDFDPLASLAADGTLPWSLEASFARMAEMTAWCDKNAPDLRSTTVSSIPYAAAGASVVDELAYLLATAVEYLRRLEAAGVAPEVGCRHLKFTVPVGRDFFFEIAKLRSLRLLWHRLTAACGVTGEDAVSPIHAITSPRTLTVRDPWVNILRGTGQAFSAVAGGAEMLTVLPFDSAMGRSDADATRLALNTSTILREECHLGHIVDPAAGSYFVENLTAQTAAAGWNRFQLIEASGGMAASLRSGVVARDLTQALADRRAAVATRRDPVTGVSTYPNLNEELPARPRSERTARLEPDDEETGVRRAVGSATEDFAAAIEAARGGLTVAEMIDVMPGRAKAEKISSLQSEREAVPFENLRTLADRHLERHGKRPRVLLAAVGAPAEHRSSAGFASNLLAAGGLAAAYGEGLDEPAAAASALGACGASSAIICASAERAPDAVPRLAHELKASGAKRVLVAAVPDERESLWRSEGVDGFVYRGCDAVEVLEELLRVEGVHHE